MACGPASAPAQHPPVQVVHHVVHHLPAAHHGPRPVHVVQEVQQPVMYPAYHSVLTDPSQNPCLMHVILGGVFLSNKVENP